MKFQRNLSVELNVQGCFVIQLSSFALLLSHQQLVYSITTFCICQELFYFFNNLKFLTVFFCDSFDSLSRISESVNHLF